MFARVAQWWSIALPRRGSRVRIPSRALKEIEKRVIRWMALFSMFKPCRARTVRMSPLRCGRRKRTSPGRSATSRALKEIQKRDIWWMSFFVCSSPAGLERFECLRSAAVVAGERPPDVLRRLVLSMIQKRGIRWVSLFLYIQVLPGSNGSNVCVPLRSSQQFQMLVKRRIAWYDKICSEMLAECISRNCRQHTIEFMHEGHTLKKV